MPPESWPQTDGRHEHLARYPLVSALIERRSRRFGRGLRLNGGPLAYESTQPLLPLSHDEEAALAFAACGITGPVLGELPYETGDVPDAGSGNIMLNFVGRTVPSPDAAHVASLFVLNDEGVWLLKRPQDYPRAEIGALAQLAREHRFVELYERSRIRLAEHRVDVPRAVPYVLPFNKWAANQPGTTYFLPVHELTALYINVMLAAFGEEVGYFLVDERQRFQPAGVAQFARSRGGHLYDDPRHGRLATLAFVETWLPELAAIEQGAMMQNMALMTQALGLGGFPHSAGHPFIWLQALGFRMEAPPLSRTSGAGPVMSGLLRLLKKDIPLPTAVGLEHNGQVVLQPFCPPYYRSMEEAVLAFLDLKYAAGTGTARDGGAATAWRDGGQVQAHVPRPSDRAIAATIAYCSYVYQRYGRFPTNYGPFRTLLAYQAHHLDTEFYQRFYQPSALSATQREHERQGHHA